MKPYDTIEDKKSQIKTMFDNIAPTYDRLNHLLSLNIDRVWRRRAVKAVAACGPSSVLDIATGTGDMALSLARRLKQVHVTGVDLSECMLAEGRAKVVRAGMDGRILMEQGDAEHLHFAEGSFDALMSAFGVRNFGDLAAGLSEMHRVLRSGGRAVILELSNPPKGVLRWMYDLYSHRMLPRIGGAVSHDAKAYEYLPASVDEFPVAEEFCEMLRAAGFVRVQARRQSFGIAHIFIAEKAAEGDKAIKCKEI